MVDLNALYNGKQAASNSGLDLNALYTGSTQGLDLNALYNGNTGSGNGVKLSIIEQIESNGKNDAVSKAGAKGLYQFMPDTAEEYSKRLFGVGTRDASSLSAEQQTAMASAYFKDLLKEFNGNVDEAVAAYNWGQGNVETDLKEHGSHWLDYAPQETQNYVEKYERIYNGGSTGYDHAQQAANPNKSRWENFEDFNKNQFKQMGDLWNGLTAEINKATGNEYSQKDIDEAEDALNSDEGKVVKTESAIAASLIAPELIPEMVEGAEASTALKGANWLAKALAGSEAYQEVENGKLSLKDTAYDVAFGAGAEGLLKALAKPAMNQISKAYHALVDAGQINPELSEAVSKYLAGSRTAELGKHMQVLQEKGLPHTVLDAYQAMAKEVPDMFKGEQYEYLKDAVKKLKNNASPTEVIDYGKSIRDRWYSEALNLAKDEAQLKKLQVIANANSLYNKGFSTIVDIADDVLPDTIMQKMGKTLEDYLGVDIGKLKSILTSRKALKEIKPVTDAFKRLVKQDNKRIMKELQELEGKTGVSQRSKYNALNRQLNLNHQMLSYVENGLKGRKVKVSDIQQAIKEVQESQFKRSGSKNITKFFKDISDIFEAMNVTKLAEDKGVVEQITKHFGLKAAGAAAGVFTGAGVPTLAIGLTATAAGKLSRMAKARNLQKAWELLHLEVESGHITPEEAEELLKQGFKSPVAKAAGRSASALRETASQMLSNQK